MGRPKKYSTEEERKQARKETIKRYYQKHKDEIAAKNATHKEERKVYQSDWYKKNRENILERCKLYYVEHKDEKAAYDREYYQNNKEYIAARNSVYNAEHKDEIAAKNAEYRQNNKEKIAAKKVEYRLTKNGRATHLANSYSRNDRKHNRGECTITMKWIVDNIFTQPCHYCGESDWHLLGCDRIDNSLPHTPENVVPCCNECNSKKARTPYDEYMRRIGKIA